MTGTGTGTGTQTQTTGVTTIALLLLCTGELINNPQKKKMLQEIFLYTFNLFNTDFIFVLQGSQIRRVLKLKNKNKSKKNYVFIKI